MNLFILQVITETWSDSTGVGGNLPTEAPQASTVVKFATAAISVPVNTVQYNRDNDDSYALYTYLGSREKITTKNEMYFLFQEASKLLQLGK